MKNSIKRNRILFLCFVFPMLLLTSLFIVRGVYPFGSKSNLMWDMEIQYTDFFSYYKNVLLGRESLSYSFSKSLGGPMTAIWGYYLSSPLNLLAVFFGHSQMQLFVFIITALKLGLCGLTFGVFLKTKYKNLSEPYTLFFSVAYAFTQYGVGQMSNIMWLDGMYMLPLMMLAVDKYTTEKKVLPLYITVALSVIFNWYTAYMNCIFIAIYFAYSYALSVEKITLKPAVKSLLGFAATGIAGVLASCIVFFPVLVGQNGGRTVFDEGIFKFETNGSLLEALRGFMLGSNVNCKNITLFCTLFALAAVCCYFLNKAVTKREKTISGVLLGIMVASMFFDPLNHIWSGFKLVNSYSYRFLYTAIAAFLTVAAREMSLEPVLKSKSIKIFTVSSIAVLLVLDMFSRFISLRLWTEIAILIAYGLIFLFLHTSSKARKRIMTAALTMLFFLETAINAYWLTCNYFESDSEKYINYAKNEEALIEQLHSCDSGLYRTEKTLNRDFSVSHDSFYGNEALGYNYYGIQHYSSSYETTSAQVLANLGYCRKEFPTFFHDPIIGADSLLGVKYLLSEREYDGYTLRTDLSAYNEKSVYENRYALPLAFYADENVLNVKANGQNPFEYLNEIYSGILGEKTELYTLCGSAEISETENGALYTVPKSNGDLILYARIKGDGGASCNISVDGGDEKGYSDGWMNHNVTVIGNMKTEHTLSVNRSDLDIEFYALDLGVLKKLSDTVGKNGIDDLKINKNNVSFTADGNGVMLTVPYDGQWEITVNGKTVDAKKGADAFIFIPLNGKSTVTMKYHTKGVAAGIALTIVSVVLIAGIAVVCKRQKNQNI